MSCQRNESTVLIAAEYLFKKLTPKLCVLFLSLPSIRRPQLILIAESRLGKELWKLGQNFRSRASLIADMHAVDLTQRFRDHDSKGRRLLNHLRPGRFGCLKISSERLEKKLSGKGSLSTSIAFLQNIPITSDCWRPFSVSGGSIHVDLPSPSILDQYRSHSSLPISRSLTLWTPSPCRATKNTLYCSYGLPAFRWCKYAIRRCHMVFSLSPGESVGYERSTIPSLGNVFWRRYYAMQ